MKQMNSKRERFLKVAETRTNKIIDMIKLLGNCANKNNYSYTYNEVKQIFNAIESELKTAKSKFSKDKDTRFSFEENK